MGAQTGGYGVDAAQLQHVDAVLRAGEAQAGAALAALTSTAEALLDGRWAGPAAAAFRLGWVEWLDAAHAAVTGLAELDRAVGLAGLAYAGTDDEVRVAVAGTPS